EGAELYGYVATGYWRDIGNIDEYRIAHHDLLAGRVQLELPGSESRHGDGTVWLDDSVTLGENVTIRGTAVIGKNASIGDDVVLENVVIGDGAVIGEGAEL